VQADLLQQYDEFVTDAELRACTRLLFRDGHYAKAIEEAYICLDNVVKDKSGIDETGKKLMFAAFHGKRSGQSPALRINRLRSKTDHAEQEGFGHIAAGCMMACRNPRAHRHGMADEPRQALAMLAWADYLVSTTRAATRTRKRTKKAVPIGTGTTPT